MYFDIWNEYPYNIILFGYYFFGYPMFFLTTNEF